MMEIILGRLWIVFFIACHVICGKADPLTVKIFDAQHEEIKEVGIGQPFTIELIIKGESGSQGQPLFEALERINGRRSGYQMNSINGNTTIIYTYQARIDVQGVYTVGPIRYGNLSFPEFSITAGPSAQLLHKKKAKKQKIHLQFFVDSSDVVIGEKIACRLRFSYSGDSIVLKHIGQQEIPGFDQSGVEGPFMGTDTIDGTVFKYKEWRWTLSALQEGSYLVPAYYADYSIQKKSHAFWPGFAHLFDNHDVKRIYSNAEKIMVHAFDDAPHPVCAVGKNVTAKAYVDNPVVAQSEGITLYIEVAGDDKSSLKAVETLEGVPQELKWYRSHGSKIDATTLRSEFVIQGLKSGDYEIPSQKLCYFDSETREYKTITTQPLLVSITPLRDPGHDVPNLPQEPSKTPVNQENNPSNSEPHMLLSQSCWYQSPQRAPLPWWFFVMMLIVAPLCVILRVMTAKVKQFFSYKSPQQQYKYAFKNALQAIEKARDNKDDKQLYSIFLLLVGIRCSLRQEEVSLERIEHELYNRFVDDATKIRWKKFFHALKQSTYGGNFLNDQLFAQAVEWVNILKKVL